MKSACITEKPNREKQHILNSLTLFNIHPSYMLVIILSPTLFHMFPLPSLTHAINSCRFDADVCFRILSYQTVFLHKYLLTKYILLDNKHRSQNYSYTSLKLLNCTLNKFIVIYDTTITVLKNKLRFQTYSNVSLYSSSHTIIVFAVLSQELENILLLCCRKQRYVLIIFKHVSNTLKYRDIKQHRC